MANYYYVKNGGAATGDAGRYTTQQTGSFAALGAANYYNDINDIESATTIPVAGDFILVSDVHSYSGSDTVYDWGLYSPCYVVAVDDANIDASRTSGNRGYENGTNGSNDLRFNNGIHYTSGMEYQSVDDIIVGASSSLFADDCKFTAAGVNDLAMSPGGDGSSARLLNCEIALNDTAAGIRGFRGFKFEMLGGSITTTTGGVTNLSTTGFTDGGASMRFDGVDMSAITGTLIANVGASTTIDDYIDVKFDMCKLASGVVFTNEDFKKPNQRLIATRCSATSAAAEYQYHCHAFGGDVDDDSSVYRNEDEPFTESNQKISYKIVTNADASEGSPLWFDFPILRYSELSSTSTDLLRFYLGSATAGLTNKDIYFEIRYPDGTNKQTPNGILTCPTTQGGTLDLLGSGTTLTSDVTSTWTTAPANLYQVDLDTSGDVGADCLPQVRAYITKPSITIYLASEFGLS